MKNVSFEDPKLGKIIFYQNQRAKNYIIRIKKNEIRITIPQEGNYTFAERFFRGNRNKIINKIVSNTQNINSPEIPDSILRKRAEEYLPRLLDELAKKHGFQYNSVKIRKSKTRWGSCSSTTNINLSFYLMLLPPHLIEYVLLHELCHTIEMNHGTGFWKLMDQHTNGKAKALRKELKQFSISNTN